MPQRLTRLPARLAALALIGLAAGAIGVREASAMGCHVEEKPTLGLSTTWDDLARPIGIAESTHSLPRVARMPCSADLPGSPERFAPAISAIDLAAGLDDGIRAVRWVEPRSIVWMRHRPSAPDRPPRG